MIDGTSPSADLVLTSLDDAVELTDYLARHALAPARRMLGIPAPDPAEGETAPPAEPFSSDDSPAHFGPVIAGLALWSGIFPHAAPSFGGLDSIRRNPASAWLDGGHMFGLWTGYARVRGQVDGLFGPPSTAADDERRTDVRYHHEPRRNDRALAELRAMQALLLRLFGDPDAWNDLAVRYENGLRHVDLEAAAELDAILRRDVHRRIVRLGTDEPILADEAPDGEFHVLRVDGGVFSADVPESIAGALALDYADGLAAHRRVARCASCRRALVISNQQGARVAKGQPVYHPECKDQARLDYWRTYQQGRRLVAG